MGVVTKYLSKSGRDYQISPNFKLREMACKDGSDKVLYSTELMAKLEELRAYGDWIIIIGSGYRTVSHNRRVGGGSKSQHLNGTAADITVRDKDGNNISGQIVCCVCQKLGFTGIGYMSETSTHVDMRPSGRYRGDERKNRKSNVNNNFFTYFNISESKINALKVEGDEDMTQDQFNEMMGVYLSQQAKMEPASWSAEARAWAEKYGIMRGTGSGMAYLSWCTREQMVEFLYRFYNSLPDTSDKDTILNAMISALQGLK